MEVVEVAEDSEMNSHEEWEDEDEEEEQKEPMTELRDNYDFSANIANINQQIGCTGGICAKTLETGAVAWRCLDCEKDPTCIICKSCFEKSDHTGHRVQLKRNVSGLCDCGDPEAWDPDHFCSDHKGGYVEANEIIGKIPQKVKESAEQVFKKVCVEIKKNCLMLLTLETTATRLGMSKEELKKSVIEMLNITFQFLGQRIQEVSAFAHIISPYFCDSQLDYPGLLKGKGHEQCCIKSFTDEAQDKEFN